VRQAQSASLSLKDQSFRLWIEINPIDLGNMKFELENDTQEGHCSMSIACNRLPSFLPSGPPSIRISEFSLFFILFQKLSDHTKILKHTNVFYHLLLNLTIYSNTWLHLLEHCLLIIWRIFTTNFIFKDIVKK